MDNLIIERIILAIFVLITLIFIFTLKFKKPEKCKAKAFFYIYINFFICIMIVYFLYNIISLIHLIMISIILFLAVNLVILKVLKLYSSKIGIYFVMGIIFVVQLGYILYTPFFSRQHDGRSFIDYQYGGHFGYMGYIFYNNSLPSSSPRDYWCFFNPPFFYVVSVLFIKLQNSIGIEIYSCLENLQILSLLYTAIFNIYVYNILKEMKIKKSICYLISFIGLSPAMVIMSGSLNNDILSIMLSTMAIFYTIRWYNEDTLKNLIKIALCISFAMMTKISSAIIAVSIAVVFLYKTIKNKSKLKKYIFNFFVFALIALPIGLWFPIKNLILYEIPVTYVQSVDEDNEANISRYSYVNRLFNIFQKESFKDKNVIMSGEYLDNNIYITTIKSFLVDEKIDYEESNILKIVINLEFVFAIIISFLYLINLIYVIMDYKKINNNWILYFLLLSTLEIILYIKFCFDFPFVFTMNFRYIVPTLISFGVITGITCENNKKLQYINNALLSFFSILSIIVFTNMV